MARRSQTNGRRKYSGMVIEVPLEKLDRSVLNSTWTIKAVDTLKLDTANRAFKIVGAPYYLCTWGYKYKGGQVQVVTGALLEYLPGMGKWCGKTYVPSGVDTKTPEDVLGYFGFRLITSVLDELPESKRGLFKLERV